MMAFHTVPEEKNLTANSHTLVFLVPGLKYFDDFSGEKVVTDLKVDLLGEGQWFVD